MRLKRIKLRGPVLPKDVGHGIMTRDAADLFKIAVTIAGFDRETLGYMAVVGHEGTGLINAATITKAMDQYTEIWEELHGSLH